MKTPEEFMKWVESEFIVLFGGERAYLEFPLTYTADGEQNSVRRVVFTTIRTSVPAGRPDWLFRVVCEGLRDVKEGQPFTSEQKIDGRATPFLFSRTFPELQEDVDTNRLVLYWRIGFWDERLAALLDSMAFAVKEGQAAKRY